jgi:hypothetical protein
VNRLDFMPRRDAITREYSPGEVIEVTQHDGSVLRLRKLAAGLRRRRPPRRDAPHRTHEARGEILTGLLYVNGDADDLHGHLKTVQQPLNRLGVAELCPGSAAMAALNAEFHVRVGRCCAPPTRNPGMAPGRARRNGAAAPVKPRASPHESSTVTQATSGLGHSRNFS